MSNRLIRRAIVLGVSLAAALSSASVGGEYNITVDPVTIDTGEFTRSGIGFNGASPGPVLRFKEGEDVTINVTNNLSGPTSIHWHGLILPFEQDGVPGISYDGIAAGETFTYNFPITQSGTYWFHSHTGFQEPDGAYGAIIIDKKKREPFRYDREYVVQLTDAHPHSGDRIMRNLKMMPDYYNRKQRTFFDFVKDTEEKGFGAAMAGYKAWGEMRMMPTDIEDLQGFTPLINGKSAGQNWTGLFKPGERIRLRFINSSAMTYFDIRIPGLKMTVVQADGNNVQPVPVDEFRIAVAETYDVIIRPKEDKAYTLFAETMGRTAFARGTLAPREGMTAEVPEMREAPLLTMADMGMAHEGMDHGAMMSGGTHKMPDGTVMKDGAMKDMADGKMAAGGGHKMPDGTMMKGMDHSAMTKADPFYAAGSGLAPSAANGGKFLSYNDLRAQKPIYKLRDATREIELRLTGNMERYSWSINNVKYEDAEPIRLKYGERVRFKFVNETMMTHPMHLHGMWSILDNGKGKWNPIKHVVSVSPGTTVYMETEVDAPGQWAFHCHLSYHADSGMFRKVVVEGGPPGGQKANADSATSVSGG
ncbi:MAG: copper resistance system multicopper oxidase [Alphaproteobacteria bacterium]|nr:copper resistance system multicopper oxidase [Alphaproteobacteria bacterium]